MCLVGGMTFNIGWMQVVRDRTNRSIVKRGAARSGTVCFNIPVRYVGNVYCAGRQVPVDTALVVNSDMLPQLRAPEQLDLIIVSVDQEVLVRELALHGLSFGTFQGLKTYNLRESQITRNLAALLKRLEYEDFRADSPIFQEWGRHQLRDEIMAQLLELLSIDQVIQLTTSVRKRLVDRACEYAMAHLDEPFTIFDMCRQIGTSRRKLQYWFQETLEISPLTYLRLLRLNAVRRELREGTVVCVQDIATRWRFSHLSRFSSEYRYLFGELPSRTLNR